MSSHASSCAGPTVGRGGCQAGVQTSEGWRLTTGIEGGPRVIDLILNFRAHIAHRLWTQLNYRVLSDMGFRKHHKPLHRLDDYVWKHPGSLDFVQASGLGHLPRCMSSHVDVALLTAFIERWQPDTNTFHMPFGEITITLHDVYYILRLPIVGNELSSISDSNTYLRVLAGLLEITVAKVEARFFRSDGFSIVRLLEHMEAGNIPYDTHEACSVYLYCLLGSMIFCNTTGSHAPVGIISGLDDVREVHTYAWGAATLAHMYRALGKASRARCKSFMGCQTLLQSWIYEYFPSLRCRVSPLPRAESEPLAGRWDGARIAPRTALEGQNRLEMFCEQLDRLTHTHVEWLPYGVNPFRGDSLWSLYRGCIHAFDYMEPHDPTRVLRHYGFRQSHMVARTAPLHTPMSDDLRSLNPIQ
ncbi:Protein MAIN-LIKE 2 [Linum grandiflorum]